MSVVVERILAITPEVIKGKAVGLTLAGEYTLMAVSVFGCSFRDILSGCKAWPCVELYPSFIEACRILAAAHQDGLWHHNLTPEDILIDGIGSVYVTGWSKEKSADTVPWKGAVGYLSPEQARGALKEIDHRSDLFSLGVILYEIIGGSSPFAATNPIEAIASTLERQATPLKRCPPELWKICLRLLEKDPKKRLSTVVELLPLLVSCLRGPIEDHASTSQDATVAHEAMLSTILPEPRALPVEKSPEQEAALPFVEPSAYDVQGELARGGLGKISIANDTRLGRHVALKEIIKNTPEARERFVREAIVTARLQHPGIVPIYEAGRWPSGSPFYAMRLVSGKPLNRVIQKNKTLQERLGLLPHMIAVAEAIAYAHSQKIIHRDLKPQNILVGEFGETVVIDWGLAKDIANEPQSGLRSPDHSTAEDGLTQMGTVIGTPAYMPPEQAQGSPVDERADVYALGSILYFLLSGAPPYQGGSPADVIQKVLLGPPRPLEEHQPEAPRDLLAIVQKAMRRDPSQRYPTAREFLEDVERFQRGQLVGVYRYTTSELLGRWIQKNRIAVTISGALVLALLGLGAYSFWSIVEEKNRAKWATQEANKQRILAEEKAAEAEEQRLDASEKQKAAERSNNELALLQASNSLQTDPAFALAWLKRMALDGPGWEFARIIATEANHRAPSKYVFRGHKATVEEIKYSLDGRYLLSASKDKTIRAWDLETGGSFTFEGSSGAVSTIQPSPNGKMLASGGEDKVVRIWNLSTKKESKQLGKHLAPIRALSYSTDGSRLASVSEDGAIRIWSLPDGESIELVKEGPAIQALDISPDGKLVAYITEENTIHIREIKGGLPQTINAAPQPDAKKERAFLRFSPDGRAIALAAFGRIQLWSVDTLAPKSLWGDAAPSIINAFAVSPDGKIIATGHQDKTVRLWFWETGEQRMFTGHTASVRALRFSPDGASLASASDDKIVRFWNLKTGTSHAYTGHAAGVKDLIFSIDGKQIASVCEFNVIRLWSTDEGNPDLGRILEGHTSAIERLALSMDGTAIAAAAHDYSIRLFNLTSNRGRLLTTEAGPVSALGISPEGRKVASSSNDYSIRVWDTFTGEESTPKLEGHSAPVRALAFSRDGLWLASGGDDDIIKLWDTSTWDSIDLKGHTGAIRSLTFSFDSKSLASASDDRLVRIWDIATKESYELDGHLDGVTAVAFSPDGARLVSASKDKTLRVWELSTKRSTQLNGHKGVVYAAIFTPDGSQIISTGEDKSVIYWDPETGRGQARAGYENAGQDLAITPDGAWLLTGVASGALVLWPQHNPPKDARELMRWFDTLTTAMVDPDFKPSTLLK